MAPPPAITDQDQLKDHPALAALLAWKPAIVAGIKLDRDELSIYVDPHSLRDACAVLREQLQYNYLSDLTCVDWYPTEPRFEVVYHLLSIPRKERVRLKVKLEGSNPAVESVTSLWPAADFYEREVFDLFGVRFEGHPNLRRIMMPDNWEGHPLRKDYPVEGYR